jgi:hypothetical protein
MVKFSAVVVSGMLGLLVSVQAQSNAPALGTPVSPDYVGLRTTRSYQPLSASPSAAKPAPVQVMEISDELRSEYRIDPFYKKTISSAGVVIVGSQRVSDWAFLEAAYTMDRQLSGSPQWVRDALSTNKLRLSILAVVEYTMDLPENSRRQRTVAEAAFQDRRSRGLGGMPNSSCAEENLLNLRGDPYGGDGSPLAGENITMHEFAHSLASAIMSQKVQGRDGKFWTAVNKAFADATAPTGHLGIYNKDRANKVYASTNPQEYWAEGTQAWFDHANARNSGGVTTRDEVKQKDPQLAALLAEIYGDGPWRYHKTTAKKADGTTLRPKEELAHLEGLDAVRDQFPVYNNRNSPRIIALMKEEAAKAAEVAAGGTNAPASTSVTNAAPPAPR